MKTLGSIVVAAMLSACGSGSDLAGSSALEEKAKPDPPTPTEIKLEPGEACPDFGLGIRFVGDDGVVREFLDKKGNVVRTLYAGSATATFTNFATGAARTFKIAGDSSVTPNSDGTETYVVAGNSVLILFPSDVPAGPTSTLYTGRVTYTIDPATGVYTFLQANGKATDICAALS